MTTEEITYQVKPYYGETTDLHAWSILDQDGTAISELFVDMTTCEIRNVWTREDHRGESLATALYRAACTTLPVRHSAEAHRTDDGARWASIVGGDTAPCTDGCCTSHDDEEIYA